MSDKPNVRERLADGLFDAFDAEGQAALAWLIAAGDPRWIAVREGLNKLIAAIECHVTEPPAQGEQSQQQLDALADDTAGLMRTIRH
jgi:hypothetical protein